LQDRFSDQELRPLQITAKRGAESHADFVHKYGGLLKELNETVIWLRVIERSELLKKEQMIGIIDENKQLCRIFTSSLNTARSNR
jgi:four helix bundle protein